uniref:Ycf15 n=1 Tax=Laguncularia racemosa TaxID=190524 RepID=A0A859ARY0_9MYRT|nr:Ycf15 [Laguncularia racemosa]UIS00665.1 Ycf15 [Laguncularia racemosa]
MNTRVQLHCIARIRVVYLKEVDLPASLMIESSSR